MITLALLLSAAGADMEVKVRVDRDTFRVKVRDGYVQIADKAVMTSDTPQIRDQMKRAVKLATGCEIDDPYWRNSKLVGKLLCP
ncbi:hypothetical protein BH11PSE5_BH11PSE5_30690 [soil metagenome]